MLTWFDSLEDSPLPPAVDDFSDDGFPVTTAPNGERVQLVSVANPDPRSPVQGAILLRHIGCHPSQASR